jgi:hypothetical protein
MDWEISGGRDGSDEEDWLVSRREDFRAKGGRSRNTSGSTEGDDTIDDGRESTMNSTPKKAAAILVADTPN